MRNFRFDGNQFCEDLQKVCENRKKRGKTPWKIRLGGYCPWAMFLMKMKIDATAGYHYPDEVLEYIRAIVPGDIKGGIRQQTYRVSITKVCEALSIQKL